MTEILHVGTAKLKEIVDLSAKIEALIRQSEMQSGLC